MLVAVGVLAAGLTGCATGTSGEREAADRVQRVAEELGEELTPRVWRERDAEWLAATHVSRAAPADRTEWTPEVVTVDAIAWSGSTTDEDGAQIDARIRVDVAAGDDGDYWGSSAFGPGTATACFRYLVFRGPRPEVVPEKIDCPADAIGPAPVASPLPALPEDAEEILAAVLVAATEGSLEHDVRAAFPEDFISVDTGASGGELIAAVGVPGERECTVGVRDAAGGVYFAWYDRTWIEPGELGCTTSIVTSPPL
ncbi:hypothetical protein E3T55_12570 [Cryobacterium frigoriphilum]|uniref:Uncharacterized protein n=1 Tax=Cryobacterium frigoriphilum TaxID=1259150 RepID=A0A4R8ZYN8_9MICO|nr:hypothetical protein [Cryobacterium frigoriphilum]TFD48878.1 hypothetical protein E3T55_12570 [Cryobacterium frigoriphilum]